MTDPEVWKDITGYENLYKVSNLGRIKSMAKSWVCGTSRLCSKGETILKKVNVNGYHAVSLWKNGKLYRPTVHRIVAIHFIPNPHNKREVNHKNGIKTDNRVANLEWVTPAENQKHAYATGLNRRHRKGEGPYYWVRGDKHHFTGKKGKECVNSKKVEDIHTGRVWHTIYECAKSLGINKNTLSRALNKKTPNKYGVRFKKLNEQQDE